MSDSPVESTKELHESKERKPEQTCPFAKSDMTPCVIKDGEMSRADDGVCVGCERKVPQFKSMAEKRRYVFQVSERIADDTRHHGRVGLSRGAEPEPHVKQGTVRPLAANERVVRDGDGRLQIERLPEPDFNIPAVLASLEKALQYLPDHIDGEFNSALSIVKRLLVSPPRGEAETPTDTLKINETERAHLIKKLRQNYPSQGCDVCDRLLAKLERRGSVFPHAQNLDANAD